MVFYHTADLHFGVENYGKLDPKTGIHSRLLDFHMNLAFIVDQAIKEHIDLFLLCGDAYKTANPTPTQQKLLVQQLLRLYSAQIPVVIVVGNHDHPLSFGKAHALDIFSDLPIQGFHVFSKPELKIIETKSGPVQIIGIPWPLKNHVVSRQEHRLKNNAEIATYLSEQIAKLIEQLANQVDRKIPAILAGHLTVATGIFSGSEKCAIFGTDPIFSVSQLAHPSIDYVALGHLHRFQNLNPTGIPVVYSGSIERIDFGERNEEKGFCRVTISGETERLCLLEFIKLISRPMTHIILTLESGRDQTEQLLDELKKHTITDAILKIVYHLPQGAKDTVDQSVIQRACQGVMVIASIIPVHKPPVIQRRAQVTVLMDFPTIVHRYLETKELEAVQKERLFGIAQTLYQEVHEMGE